MAKSREADQAHDRIRGTTFTLPGCLQCAPARLYKDRPLPKVSAEATGRGKAALQVAARGWSGQGETEEACSRAAARGLAPGLRCSWGAHAGAQ